MSEIVIDIETAPHKAEEYKANWPASKKKPGLHALISEVCCIGIYELESNHASVISRSNMASEEEILSWACKLFRERRNDTIVTYNGKAFDAPILGLRASLYGIPLNKYLPDKRSQRHKDLYDILGGKWATDISSCSLSELAWCLLGTPKSSNGSDVAKWFSEGDYEKIDNHCLEDIKITTEIYNKLKGIYW